MIKRNKLLWYQLRQDTTIMLLLLAICIFIMCIGNMITKNTIPLAPENIPIIAMVVFCNSATLSYQKLGEYTTLGFCRRKFYHEQVILCLLRAMLLSLFFSIYEFINYNHLVNYFIKDTTDSPSMYHPIPLMELFLTNMCIFALLYLIYLVNISHTISIIFINKSEKTLQLQLRKQMKKQKYKWFYRLLTGVVKCISFVLLVGYLVGFQLYYQIQMQSSLSTRMIVLGIFAGLCVVVYLDGRWRFRPKYV